MLNQYKMFFFFMIPIRLHINGNIHYFTPMPYAVPLFAFNSSFYFSFVNKPLSTYIKNSTYKAPTKREHWRNIHTFILFTIPLKTIETRQRACPEPTPRNLYRMNWSKKIFKTLPSLPPCFKNRFSKERRDIEIQTRRKTTTARAQFYSHSFTFYPPSLYTRPITVR